MWIVRLALRRPYTFVVLSLLLFFLGTGGDRAHPGRHLPNIDIPVVSVYLELRRASRRSKLSGPDCRCPSSAAWTTTVNDIEAHGVADAERRLCHQGLLPPPNVKHLAGRGAGSRPSHRRRCAVSPGTTPPLIIQYTAHPAFPVLQLGLLRQRPSQSTAV